MEGKKLKYPRKATIETTGYADDIKPIIAFAEEYKRGPKSEVKIHEYSVASLRRRGSVPRVCVTFYTYEPIGELRQKFEALIWKSDFVGGVFVEGWMFRFPNIKERWLG